MEYLVIGIVTAVNMIIILLKVKRSRYEDAVFDVALLATVTVMFSGSFGGMVVSMIASMIISIYLFANPPTFFRGLLDNEEANLVKAKLQELRQQASMEIKKKVHETCTPVDTSKVKDLKEFKL